MTTFAELVMLRHAPIIKLMHGPSDWEKMPHIRRDPPSYKRLPRRPSKEKEKVGDYKTNFVE